MKYDIIKYILCSLAGAIITALVTYIRGASSKMWVKHKNDEENDDKMVQAVKMLLRGQIKADCTYYIQRESITQSEYDELSEEITIYESDPFNGDGLVHKLWEQVQAIEIKKQ